MITRFQRPSMLLSTCSTPLASETGVRWLFLPSGKFPTFSCVLVIRKAYPHSRARSISTVRDCTMHLPEKRHVHYSTPAHSHLFHRRSSGWRRGCALFFRERSREGRRTDP